MESEKIRTILDRLAIGPPYNDVYWIGRRAVRLTFLSQQQRALNLVWALKETGKIGPGRDVTVVGAGIAGITAAFAAYHLGARVQLIENKQDELHLQRGCQLRFVHPHVLDWPDPSADVPMTDLPCLNWGADYAARICDVLLKQWVSVRRSITRQYGYEVRRIEMSRGRPLVFAEGRADNLSCSCDCLILAVGFGLERQLPSVPFLSYWENDNFGRPVLTGPIPRRYLVTGCGDGGLLDAIRLRIVAFDHAGFLYHLSREIDLETRDRLGVIEREVTREVRDRAAAGEFDSPRPITEGSSGAAGTIQRPAREEDVAGQLLEERYRQLAIPMGVRDLIRSNLRRDTTVFLNSPNLSPLSLGASVLNRFLVFLLREHGGLRYRAGKAEPLPTASGQPLRVRFQRDEFPAEEVDVHEVVVRHGPVPAIERLFPRQVAESCRPGPGDYDDPTRGRMYPPGFMETPVLREQKQTVRLEYAISSFPLAAQDRFDALLHDRFGIEVRQQTDVGYVLRPLQAGVSKSAPFNGFGIRLDHPVRQGRAVPAEDHRLRGMVLSPGVGLQNRDEHGRPAVGTLGCFVQPHWADRPALLTSAVGLRGSGRLRNGDRIVREHGGPLGPDHVIADIQRLHLPTPSSPRASLAAGNSVMNEYEGAVAVLRPGLEFDRGFGTRFPELPRLLPPPEYAPEALLGARVFKVGRSGVTWGTINVVETTTQVQGADEQYWYDGLFGIAGNGGLPFCERGDNGSLVVREDGAVLGMLVALGHASAWAFPIQALLRCFECDLLLADA